MTRPIGTREIGAALRVLASGKLSRFGTRGPSETQQFETALRETVGARHALAVNSGTSALICALVGAGVGPGDEVLVPAYTWVSTAAAPLAVGAVPVLVEMDASLTIDPVDIKRKITPRTKAIIPVHMLNLVCDMDSIMRLATDHDLVVIEDACQAVGVRYHGRRVGTIGHAGAFSFNQHKNIKSGEGGAVVTNDDRIYARAGMYHDVGSYTRDEQFETDEPLFVGRELADARAFGGHPAPATAPARRAVDRAPRSSRIRAQDLGGPFTAPPSPSVRTTIPTQAVGLTVSFDDPEEAAAFASARGVSRLIDTGRHVYTNWQSIISRRTAHPGLDPYKWAEHDGAEITADTCPQTLEVLARTCNINLMPELPMPAFRAVVRLMAR